MKMNKKETPESIAGKRGSLSRYHQAYLEFEFEGLKPKTGYKRSNNNLPDNFEEVIEHAIILRREIKVVPLSKTNENV